LCDCRGDRAAAGGILKQVGRAVAHDKQELAGELGATHPVYEYPAEIRRVIYTTNAIESVNSSLRKVLKNRGSFPDEEAAIKLVYLALRNISGKWSLPIRDWSAAMNQFAILFEGRVPVGGLGNPFTQNSV
jgi:transposase-like protein